MTVFYLETSYKTKKHSLRNGIRAGKFFFIKIWANR